MLLVYQINKHLFLHYHKINILAFTVYPILSFIEDLYQMPIGEKRFKHYLQKLQGTDKNDLKAPIMGYNPMAKEHALLQIKELQQLGAESKAKHIIETINTYHPINQSFQVIINLADDLRGAWSEKHATEFDSKFRFEGIYNKGFCTPYFFTSEELNESIISQRIKEAIYRTIYWIKNKDEKDLDYFFKQEVFVSQQCKTTAHNVKQHNVNDLDLFLNTHRSATDYNLIFNFFYGDEASEKLGYKTYGISSLTGFELATIYALNNQTI